MSMDYDQAATRMWAKAEAAHAEGDHHLAAELEDTAGLYEQFAREDLTGVRAG
ncbi:hypothetical protein [Williamsia sterculiae]|uniref:Uncharacterized protein n=1 Tax=Williamsia sterculiae TaxID=1344003 RepID=A0A1N7HE20_9NOCA|nr:hypothetical protein [Williamsia sterculiae]SIS23134.1 hypothetical protein SAMN05445060_4061 [Williamsia sterculiae]